jgi:hypothetical protein
LLVILAACVFSFASEPASVLNLPADGAYDVDDDDAMPDVTSRVARISFIRGEAKVKHADSDEWEKAVLNLPVVEGDELATDAGARLEIQLDNYQHVRMDENSFLKVTTLKDGGVALSISLGTMSARITSFDKDRSFFEIDAPKTTVALQKAGSYRIDAGRTGESEIRVSATEGGEARIYSDTAGFTLKKDRTARVFIDGDDAGEWESADASLAVDEFDTWGLGRDSVIAQRMADAYYDKYYDQDIYGADDLNGYGEWVHSSTYGYVWRPYAATINSYTDWSPYRYGQWRWIPPYGWVWINDEPWGWATYHHGRWFYDNGFWYWSPYGYYRYSRSWWLPALVAITIVENNVCWYPLPYHCRYYNYNWHHNHHGGHWEPPRTGGIKPIPPRIITPNTDTDPPTGGIKQPPVSTVPPRAVIAVSTAVFGTTTKGGQTPPIAVAKSVLASDDTQFEPPRLPVRSSLTGRMNSDIIRATPSKDVIASQTKVGAGVRQQGEPLDNELRKSRIFGGRPPLAPPENGGVRATNKGDTRPTGAVVRPPIVESEPVEPVRQPPVDSPPVRNDPPVMPPIVKTPRPVPTVKPPTPRYDPPVKQPTYTPPSPPKTPPRSDPPTKSTPKPPPTKSPGKSGSSNKDVS